MHYAVLNEITGTYLRWQVLERDQKLTELDERADALQDGASQFEKQAGKLKNKFWMQNAKLMMVGAIVGLILLILLYFKFSDDDPKPAYFAPPHSSSSKATD
jgi:hypothetical protein